MQNRDITVMIIDDAVCGQTPVLPYVGMRYDGKVFTRLAKHYLAAALLRCGFDAVDGNPESAPCDVQDIAFKASRRAADACIVISYAAFGSRRSFNDVCGITVHSPADKKSKVFCEDVCAALSSVGKATIEKDGFGAINCECVTVDCGYLTDFAEAALVYDPDRAQNIAEAIARGVCERFGQPYRRRDDVYCYPLIGAARRGKTVKLLQCLLNAAGHRTVIDGVFGAATSEAVKNYCAENSFKSSGCVTPEVWRGLLIPDRERTVYGSKGGAAVYMRRKLLSKLYRVEPTGAVDDELLDVLNNFCARNELPPVDRGNPPCAQVFEFLSGPKGCRPRLY